MTEHNLRYFGLAALTGLTIVGWILEKLTPEITTAVFAGIGALVVADVIKARNITGK